MFKIIDENYEKELFEYKLPESWKFEVGDEIWCKIRLTDIMGFDRLFRLMNQYNDIEGSKYMGFQISQIFGDVVDKSELKNKMIGFIQQL